MWMAVAYDLGDAASPFGAVHPRYKQDVGKRLALGARAVAYGEALCWAGPVFTSWTPVSAGIASVAVDMGNCGLLVIRNSTGAEVCGDGSACALAASANTSGWHAATITGSAGPAGFTVQINPAVVSKITAVRYAWSAAPCDYMTCSVLSASRPSDTWDLL